MRALRQDVLNFMICCALILSLVTAPILAQDAVSFLTYDCEFVTDTNSLVARGAVTRAGVAVPQGEIQVAISDAEGNALPAGGVTLSPSSPYRPVKITLVLDVTGSVPVRRVADAVQASFSQMPFEDEVAVISFGREVGTLSTFYKDKNALYNEQLQSLNADPSSGNRLFDALFTAIDSAADETNTRQVVVVLTDSRRDTAIEQSTAEEIIRRAQEKDVQVYAVTFKTRNGTPDTEELGRIAGATNGFLWNYDGETGEEAVGVGVKSLLDQFVGALNSEYLFTVDAGLLEAPAGQVTLNITLTVGGAPVSDTVNCTVQQLNHAINFLNVTADEVITASKEIEVEASSDLRLDDLSILFAVNGEPKQNTGSPRFIFDPAEVPPGATLLQAELRDARGNTLASAQVNLFVRFPLTVSVVGAEPTDLSGAVTFEAVTADSPAVETVFFAVRSASDPAGREFPLGVEQVPVINGTASLTLEDIHEDVLKFFPTEPDDLEVVAYVPGAARGEFFARSEPLAITLGVPASVTPEVTPEPETTGSQTVDPVQAMFPGMTPIQVAAPIAAAVILLIVDLFLVRAVGRGRIKRLIDNPDDHELPDHPLKVSVVSASGRQSYMLTKKTMFVGRGTQNEINLGEDNNISREHGVIMWRGRKWYYTNRKPKLKAMANNKRAVGYKLVPLKDGSQIQISSAVLVIHREGGGAVNETQEFIKTNLEGW